MTDLKVNVGDPISARKWNQIVDNLPGARFGVGGGPGLAGQTVVPILNTAGRALAFGDLIQIRPGFNGPDSDRARAIGTNFECIVGDMAWATELQRPAIVANDIPENRRGFAVISGLAVARISERTSLSYAFVDPDDPTQLKPSSSGFARLLSLTSGGGPPHFALIQMGDDQNIWRVQLADDSTESDVRSAQLLNLDGTQYAPLINVADPDGAYEDLETGDRGLALLSGNDFYAIGSSGGIDCEAICNKCDPVASESGECTPETDPACCEAISSARCKYTNKSISGLSLTYDGTTYVQVGDSDYPGPTSTCSWRVPVSIDGASEPVDAFVTREDGSNTWVVSAGGRTWKSGLDTSCSATPTVDTADALGTGSFTATSPGACDPPPTETEACGVVYPGTIYPRVRVSGYPANYSTQSSVLQQWSDPFGVEGCGGTFYNATTVEIQNANGTFLGPPLLEPGLPLDPPQLPPDGTVTCHEISVRTALFNGANLQCTTNDVPCEDVNLGIDRNHSMTVEGTSLRFRAFQATTYQGDMTCPNATGVPQLYLPAPGCGTPNGWEDISRTYNVTLRRLVNDTPFTYECYDITIEMDYVLL